MLKIKKKTQLCHAHTFENRVDFFTIVNCVVLKNFYRFAKKKYFGTPRCVTGLVPDNRLLTYLCICTKEQSKYCCNEIFFATHDDT